MLLLMYVLFLINHNPKQTNVFHNNNVNNSQTECKYIHFLINKTNTFKKKHTYNKILYKSENINITAP